jgi:hypothetical protein
MKQSLFSSRKRAGEAVGWLKPSNLIDRLRLSILLHINTGYSQYIGFKKVQVCIKRNPSLKVPPRDHVLRVAG